MASDLHYFVFLVPNTSTPLFPFLRVRMVICIGVNLGTFLIFLPLYRGLKPPGVNGLDIVFPSLTRGRDFGDDFPALLSQLVFWATFPLAARHRCRFHGRGHAIRWPALRIERIEE